MFFFPLYIFDVIGPELMEQYSMFVVPDSDWRCKQNQFPQGGLARLSTLKVVFFVEGFFFNQGKTTYLNQEEKCLMSAAPILNKS